MPDKHCFGPRDFSIARGQFRPFFVSPVYTGNKRRGSGETTDHADDTDVDGELPIGQETQINQLAPTSAVVGHSRDFVKIRVFAIGVVWDSSPGYAVIRVICGELIPVFPRRVFGKRDRCAKRPRMGRA